MQKAVVVGVTGYAGGHIAEELAGREFEVVGVARSTPAEPIAAIGFESGSLHDAAFVERVVEGADILILAVRSTDIASGGGTYAEAVAPFLNILAEKGVRLGVVGGAGTLRMPGTAVRNMDRPDFDPAFGPEAVLQAELLEMLKAGPERLDWFYLSPPLLFGSYAQSDPRGTYRVGDDELIFDEAGGSHISGEDYALAFVDEIERPRHRRRRFTVGN